MNQPTEVVPFVHAFELNPITQPDGHPLGDVYIVRNEQCLTITDVDNKSLVSRAFTIVRQQAPHTPGSLDPGIVVLLVEFGFQITQLQAPS